VTVAVGLVHAATAAAYLFLFVVAVGEVRSARRVTSFGAALTLMFLGCGMHHAVHAEHALIFGRASSPLVLAGLLVAAVPSAIFLALRLEAMRGGRGDRFLGGTPAWLALAPTALGAFAGILVLAALAEGPSPVTDVPGLASNLVFLLCLLLFLSIEAGASDERLAAIAADRPPIATALAHFAWGTRQYLLVTTVFGLIVAVLDSVALWLLGVPLALTWGFSRSSPTTSPTSDSSSAWCRPRSSPCSRAGRS